MFFGVIGAVMDEVELALPEAAVVGSKLMGSEGFSGGGGYVRAAVGKVQAGLPENNSVMISTSFDACSQRGDLFLLIFVKGPFFFKFSYNVYFFIYFISILSVCSCVSFGCCKIV